MTELNRQAMSGLARFLIVFLGLIFLPAWTLDYWQGWFFAAVFFGACLIVSLYVMKNDPALLARRMRAGPRAEKETSQKIIQTVASVAFVASVTIPAVDHRFGWSIMPPYVAIAGDVIVAFGFLVIFLVFRENSFASATIQVDAGQSVVTTGPYRLVRHPMYSGALVMFVGIPLALGSWWGLFILIPLALVLVWRLLDEEKLLIRSLPGYADYRAQVKYRLVPRIW